MSCALSGCTASAGRSDFSCAAANCTCGTPNFAVNATGNGCGAISGDYYATVFRTALGTGTAKATGLVPGGFSFSCPSGVSPCTAALGTGSAVASLPGLAASASECIPSPTDYVYSTVNFRIPISAIQVASFLAALQGNFSAVVSSMAGAPVAVRPHPSLVSAREP